MKYEVWIKNDSESGVMGIFNSLADAEALVEEYTEWQISTGNYEYGLYIEEV